MHRKMSDFCQAPDVPVYQALIRKHKSTRQRWMQVKMRRKKRRRQPFPRLHCKLLQSELCSDANCCCGVDNGEGVTCHRLGPGHGDITQELVRCLVFCLNLPRTATSSFVELIYFCPTCGGIISGSSELVLKIWDPQAAPRDPPTPTMHWGTKYLSLTVVSVKTVLPVTLMTPPFKTRHTPKLFSYLNNVTSQVT